MLRLPISTEDHSAMVDRMLDPAGVPTADVILISFAPGMFAHNMPCAVSNHKSAIFDGDVGVFRPGRDAHADGWRLLKVRPERLWLFKLLRRLFSDDNFME